MSVPSRRANTALSIKQYNDINYPSFVKDYNLDVPDQDIYVLRMLIRRPFDSLTIPQDLKWVQPVVEEADQYQRYHIKINHPFCYLTIRSGTVRSENDDVWHVDGFSLRFNHLPEQNYLWCSDMPTELAIKKIPVPYNFDPMRHNLHWYIQECIVKDTKTDVSRILPKAIYCLDPYVIHRRPPSSWGKQRTLIRVSFTPIEIMDVNNTENPLMLTSYRRDGVKEFRDHLVRYHD